MFFRGITYNKGIKKKKKKEFKKAKELITEKVELKKKKEKEKLKKVCSFIHFTKSMDDPILYRMIIFGVTFNSILDS
jgi:hypothetical protein